METLHIATSQTIVEHVYGSSHEKTITLGEHAHLHALFVVRGSTFHLNIMTEGVQSSALITCLFLSKDGEHVEGKVFGTLSADNSSVELYLLSLLGNRADAQVDGGVNIAKDVKKVSGHLLEENVVLGKKVKIKTLPMLDVRSNDVSASHGAKVDRLDESKLFYMMARGLDQQQSQKLIVQGYIQRACESMNLQEESQEFQKIMIDTMSYLDMHA